jgi:anti-sigma-K factor RskA
MVNRHEEVSELIPAYALGSLDAAEAVEVERHLRDCAACRLDLAAYEPVVDALALAAPDAEPSPALRLRLLAEVAHSGAYRGASSWVAAPAPPAPAPKAAPHPQNAPPAGSPWVRPAWASYALLILLAASLVALVWLAARTPEEPPVVSLTPSEVAPDASGELRFDPAGGAATLEVWRLPPLPADRQYQLWLIRDGERDSGAVFSVNDNGWAELPIDQAQSPEDFTGLGITIEPAGGSPGPTGERVLEYDG